MEIEINHRPSYALAIVTLEANETVVAEGGAMDAAELARLKALLDHRDGDLGALNGVLVQAIRGGEMDDKRGEVLDHLRQTAADKLALANPRYLTPRG